MDAFAVSIGLGIKDLRSKLRLALSVAFLFAFFQSIMPVIGWLMAQGFKDYILDYDHWVAFILLFIIGAKMINDGVKPSCQEKHQKKTSKWTFLLLAIATSIDALAVGLSFAFLDMNIVVPIILIGSVTFVLCFIGVYLGKAFACKVQKIAEILGGLILILIGLKIVIEHYVLNGGVLV